MRVTCRVCGRRCAAYVPKGGDGSAVRPRRHQNKDRVTCPGSFGIYLEWTANPR